MTSNRKQMLLLFALDVLSAILVFNVIANYRGISAHFIVSPLLVPIAALIVAIFLIDGYNGRTDMLSVDYTSLHTIAGLAGMAGSLLITFVFFPYGEQLHSSRAVIAVSFLILIPMTIAYRRMFHLQAAANRGASSFVFLGSRVACHSFREECWRMGLQQPVIDAELGTLGPEAVVGKADPLHRAFEEVLRDTESRKVRVEAIVLGDSPIGIQPEVAQRLARLFFAGVPTYTLDFFQQVYWHKIPLRGLDPAWIFQDGFRITREPVFERVKRVTDVGLAAVGLLLASPLIVVAMAAIWIEDRGPVLFRQNRVGKNRISFRLVKLRTMRDGSEKDDPYTQPGDSRITRVGRLLRNTRFDELPQLWNVLRGDMSLIGPRAEWDRLVDDYERQIPCYYFRHLVKPGITGWAQVNYRYGANLEDTVRKLEYDLYYIRYFSFRMDASIVLKTVHIMLFGKGR